MNRKGTASYLLILSLAALIPISAHLATSGAAHIMVPFTSYQELKQFILTKGCNHNPGLPSTLYASASASAGSASTTPSHSETNAQVAGVDELDTVKNDGQYIYTISNNTIAIVLAYPAAESRLVARVPVDGSLQGIFVHGSSLAVVSQEWHASTATIIAAASSGAPTLGLSSRQMYPPYVQVFGETTFLRIFDLTNHSSPTLKTTLVVNGTLAGARLIGDYVYLVATQPVSCYNPILLPERVLNGRNTTATPSEIYHSDISDYGHSFTSVVGLDITHDAPNLSAKIFLIGTSSTIYVSLHDIYLTQPVWSQSEETVVHRINIDSSSITYEATGVVPGHVLNQFSMDEFNGYFRLATTNRSSIGIFHIGPNSNQLQTNVYVLDRSLHVAGSLQGLSRGEAIYSARFLGEKAYLVTFKRTDPLFVIGLQDPSHPRVLGQLDVTGVSDYLQPYDETHLIGFGKSSVDVTWENAALFTGLKLSLFDVTDPNHPTETSRYSMGDRGSDSPALYDHKAVLFDHSLNLIVIPVEIASRQDSTTASTWSWNPYIWQGAYVFNLTLENGLVFRGGITHLQNGELPNWTHSGRFITRTLHIGNILYTISNDMVKMNSLADLSEQASVNLA